MKYEYFVLSPLSTMEVTLIAIKGSEYYPVAYILVFLVVSLSLAFTLISHTNPFLPNLDYMFCSHNLPRLNHYNCTW